MGNSAGVLLAGLFICLLVGTPGPGRAETLLRVDARQHVAAPQNGYIRMGTAQSPSGTTLGVTSLFLTRDGQPWLPVMGEFHYTRFPARYWEEELLKMKAAGVNIIATYVIWNHHEERPGEFNWSADRNLRAFIELCARHGLYAWVRLGPWTHGEARFGGTPDWVVASLPTRSNDPAYLQYVERYWREIAVELKGLLWKDGGPVIGVQLENEYNLAGAGRGAAHILKLKDLARSLGIDVPYYSVTGWDGAIYPAGEVLPMFGGYPDAPWDMSTGMRPPEEVYSFRFDSRVAGNVGTQTAATVAGTWIEDRDKTPFLGAEFGGGVPAMYRRRSAITADDIGAMLPVQLGSGVNLYGYYMFHGGRNPTGRTTLEENTLTGGYNDVPIKGYDFQAPLGQYGDQHVVMSRIRRVHGFLAEFGPLLATMTVRRPEVVPRGPEDLNTPRYSVRSNGDAGFLFVNNYVRQYHMRAQQDVRFSIATSDAVVTLPSRPVDIPAGAYFIWPFNLELAGVRLRYATAQPITRLRSGTEDVYVFFAQDGIPAEFAFAGSDVAAVRVRAPAKKAQLNDDIVVSGITAGSDEAMHITAKSGARVRIVVLTEAQSRNAWVMDLHGQRRLVLSGAQLFSGDDDTITMRSIGAGDFRIGVLPPFEVQPYANARLRRERDDGAFQVFSGRITSRVESVKITPLRNGVDVPAVAVGGAAHAAMQPAPETFGRAAAWSLSIPTDVLNGLSDAYLEIDYQGDIGRVFHDFAMLDDHYYNGIPWRIGLKRFTGDFKEPWVVTVLPLRSDAPIYIEEPYRPSFVESKQVASLVAARILPEYQLTLRFAR